MISGGVCPITQKNPVRVLSGIQQLQEAPRILSFPEFCLVVIRDKNLDLPPLLHSVSEFEFDFELSVLELLQRELQLPFCEQLPSEHQEDWRQFISKIGLLFSRVFQFSKIRLRVGRISHDQCTLFHVDQVFVRLFLTLEGPGTEYLLPNNVLREGLGSGYNEKIVKDPTGIQHANSGEILIMRGEKWIKGQGLVHRSPEIEKHNLRRTYVSIDPVV
jgi:hypothetical protein